MGCCSMVVEETANCTTHRNFSNLKLHVKAETSDHNTCEISFVGIGLVLCKQIVLVCHSTYAYSKQSVAGNLTFQGIILKL